MNVDRYQSSLTQLHSGSYPVDTARHLLNRQHYLLNTQRKPRKHFDRTFLKLLIQQFALVSVEVQQSQLNTPLKT